MCGRFFITVTPADVAELMALYDLDDFPARYNIAPTQPILMVAQGPRSDKGSNLPERISVLVRWGLIPSWVKDLKTFPLLLNARTETVIEKGSFKAAIRHRRTLIPASGFYEWKRTGEKKAQAYMVRPRHGGLVAFAGLMETYLAADGSEIDTGAILTTESNAAFMPIHDRLPVVIKPEHYDRWLDCRTYEPREVVDLFGAVEDDYFEAIPISDKVNKVANTGPEIQDRVSFNEAVNETQTTLEKKSKADGQMKLF
ncbi:MAG: SOS response-associated peptidase [Rhizobiaceae bacterium]